MKEGQNQIKITWQDLSCPIQTIPSTSSCALISVFDKTGIVDFARGLNDSGMNLLSTDGTADLLKKQGLSVRQVADYTEYPEMMRGRVKTLHPKIYGGLLARPGIDQSEMKQYNIEYISMLVVNLYPFQVVTATPTCDLTTALEHIDIGGVALIRAAAKNYESVVVVVDPEDYPVVLAAFEQGNLSLEMRYNLASKAFRYVADYDQAIAHYFEFKNQKKFPEKYLQQYVKKQDLRYGENPHQSAAFYVDASLMRELSIATIKQLQGKELSFNNIVDADTALECVRNLSGPACVIVKHANPCGVAIGQSVLDAYQRAYCADPSSAFGGVMAFNRPLDLLTATTIIKQQFVEIILAPRISEEIQQCLRQKPNIRLLTHDVDAYDPCLASWMDCKRVRGGLLVQDSDATLDLTPFNCMTQRAPTASEYSDLLFAWQVSKFVKSNAIVLVKDQMIIGIGGGQPNRVYSVRLALMKAFDAGLETMGASMASDAFFPFEDSINAAAEAGISAIIQPGGSLKDKEVMAAADRACIAMLFTGIRHFRH